MALPTVESVELQAHIPATFHVERSQSFPLLSLDADGKTVIVLLAMPPKPVYVQLPQGVGVDFTFGALNMRRLHVPAQTQPTTVYMHGVPFVHAKGGAETNFDYWGAHGMLVESPQQRRSLELDPN